MYAQRPADTADLHEHLDEVRFGGQEFTELVDHQHQGRNRLQRRARRPRLLVVVDVGVVARVAQHLLAAVEFAADGVAHAVDQGQIVREVGDDGRDVRHLCHAREGRAALEVREDEVQGLGGVRHRQAQHQGAQQLRLAGTGGAHAQAVRAHALLCGLLEVQHHGPAVLAESDRHAQPLGQRTRPPGALGVDGRRVAEVQQVGELQVGEQGFVVVPAGCHPQGASCRARASADS